MDVVHFPDDPRPPRWMSPVLALGNFDGLHRGHQKIIERIRRRRKRRFISQRLREWPEPRQQRTPSQKPQQRAACMHHRHSVRDHCGDLWHGERLPGRNVRAFYRGAESPK